jgi:hypothetical protein
MDYFFLAAVFGADFVLVETLAFVSFAFCVLPFTDFFPGVLSAALADALPAEALGPVDF